MDIPHRAGHEKVSSISGSAPAYVIALSRCEACVRADQEMDEGGHLFGPAYSANRNARNHIVDGWLWQSVEKGRGNYGRRDCVDRDIAFAGDFLCQGLGQSNQASLAGGVSSQRWISLLASYRRHIDDPAIATFQHPGNYRPTPKKGTNEVNSQHGLQIGLAQFPDGCSPAGDAGIIDEDVGPTQSSFNLRN